MCGDHRGSPSVQQTASTPQNARSSSQKVYSDFDAGGRDILSLLLQIIPTADPPSPNLLAAISEIKGDFEKHRESIRSTSRSMNFNAFNGDSADQDQQREELPEIALGMSVSAGSIPPLHGLCNVRR